MTNKVPVDCMTCLNLRADLECEVLLEYIEENCFARVTDHAELAKRIEGMIKYSGKKGEYPQSWYRSMSVEAERLRKKASDKEDREIQQCFVDEQKKGARKGGGEKEKSPNKKKTGNKIFIPPWEGFFKS